MLLSRWTGITAVFSRRYADACLPNGKWEPRWTALFRAIDGSRSDVTSTDRRCQVLFADHGSVTTDTWLMFLRHILPTVDNPEHAIVPVTDWYGPHMTEAAIDLAKQRTKSPTLIIGGGTTGEAAVCDKTPHRFLSHRFKELEMCAHTNNLRMRPDKVPRWTKQNVLDRGWEAWQDLDHTCGEELHRSHGYTNKVDGTEDGGLDSSIVHFWHELEMPAVRKKILEQVKVLMTQKVLNVWDDASDIMEPHDPHRVSWEGEEDAEIVEGEDSSDDDDRGGDGDDGDGGPGGRGLSTHEDDGEFEHEADNDDADNDGGDAGDDGGGDGDDCDDRPVDRGLSTHEEDGVLGNVEDIDDFSPTDDDCGGDDVRGGMGGCDGELAAASEDLGRGSIPDAVPSALESCRGEAVRTLREECGPEKRDLLQQMGALADKAGEPTLARDVRERLRKLTKRTVLASSDVAVGIRAARLERQRVAEANRQRLADEDLKAKELINRTKLAELKRRTATQEARGLATEAKMLESRRKMKCLTHAARQAKTARDNDAIARTYAAEVCEKLLSLTTGQKTAMKAAAGRRSASVVGKSVKLPRQLPKCWPPGVVKKTMRRLIVQKTKVEGEVYASEAFLWKLYDNRRPEDVLPLEAKPSWRLAKLLERRLPGWEQLFKSRWSATDLISLSGNIADAAFLDIVHMYKAMIGPHFPTGVFDWPPTEWLQSYHERKERVRDSKAHCDEPEKKRQRLLGATAVKEKTRTVAAGCQPTPACESLTEALARGPKSAGQPRTEAAGRILKSVGESRTGAAGRIPMSADKPRTGAAGCQPKAAGQTLTEAAGCKPKTAAKPGTGAAGLQPKAAGRGQRSSGSSSSSGPTVVPTTSTAPAGMLTMADKWSADIGHKL